MAESASYWHNAAMLTFVPCFVIASTHSYYYSAVIGTFARRITDAPSSLPNIERLCRDAFTYFTNFSEHVPSLATHATLLRLLSALVCSYMYYMYMFGRPHASLHHYGFLT
jgi:hypothetical protein